MQISPGKSKSNAATLRKAAAQRMLVKILHCTISGRRFLVAALLAGVVSFTVAAAAQEERPQITPGERKAPRKKEAGPRALAVLQLGANGKASLVPVAILVNGKFWDATAYKADPVPMALESGTVYEAARAGKFVGAIHGQQRSAQQCRQRAESVARHRQLGSDGVRSQKRHSQGGKRAGGNGQCGPAPAAYTESVKGDAGGSPGAAGLQCATVDSAGFFRR